MDWDPVYACSHPFRARKNPAVLGLTESSISDDRIVSCSPRSTEMNCEMLEVTWGQERKTLINVKRRTRVAVGQRHTVYCDSMNESSSFSAALSVSHVPFVSVLGTGGCSGCWGETARSPMGEQEFVSKPLSQQCGRLPLRATLL